MSSRLKNSSGKSFAFGLSGFRNQFRTYVRSVFKRVFHRLLDGLGIRRLREHSFFATLLARPAAIGDFGAHRGEFFAAFAAEYRDSRALLIEADPHSQNPSSKLSVTKRMLFMLRSSQKANKGESRSRDPSSLSLRAFSRNGRPLTG